MRPRRLFASAFLLLAIAAPAVQFPVRSVAAADTVQLRAHTGDVALRRAKGGASPVVPGPLSRRDELETHSGTATIELPSGIVLDLGAETLLAVIGGGGTIDAFLAHGSLAVTAGTPANRGYVRPVQVATAIGRLDLRVHEARIEATADRVLLQVIAGTAEVVVKNQRIPLASGQELELRSGGGVGTPRPLAPVAPKGPVTPPAVVETPAPPKPEATTGQPTIGNGAGTTTAVVSRPEVPPPAPAPVAPPPPPPPVAVAPAPAVVTPSYTAVPAAVPEPPKKEPFFGFTTLRLLRDKNLISQGEFDSALRDLHEAVGPRGADSATLVMGKWKTTLYGFVQGDLMWHSTQSFNDFGSNFQVARPGTYAGDHDRMEASVRDSRIGFRVQAPEVPWFRASAVFELDLLGPTGTIGNGITEGSYFVNPVLRVRHAYFKAETPIVDVLFGQYWHLFGNQPNYVPTVIQWPGLVGELFSRTTQLRISKTIKTKPVTVEIAVAGMRPPQRDSSFPEFEAAFRLSFNKWTAVHTNYMTSTSTMAASIAVSADLRRFTLPELVSSPMSTNSQLGMGIAVNAFLPIIRATKEHRDNSLSILAEFVTGQGINDLYTGLTGGVSSLAPPAPPPGAPPSSYVADVDLGLAVYDVNGTLELPRWTTFLVGLEYYLPRVSGKVGLFANFSRSQLHNPELYGIASKVRDNEIFCNAGFFVDIIEAVRVGLDYGRFDDTYADGVHAINHAVQFTGFLFF
jgi:hypothetical protein